MKRLALFPLIALAALSPASSTFTPLGFALGGTDSRVYGVSPNGKYLCGSLIDANGDSHAFVWSSDKGYTLLSMDPTVLDANAVNDALVVAGNNFIYDPQRGVRKFGQGFNVAFDLTSDGSIFSGLFHIAGQAGYVPGRSTAAAHWEQLPGFPANTFVEIERVLVSNDGSVVAGTSSNHEFFRWTAGGGVQFLSAFGRQAYLYGMSPDGQVLVGELYGPSGRDPIRWTPSQGFQICGPDSNVSPGRAVSANGNVILGGGTIWFSANGSHLFKQYLVNTGATGLSQWTYLETWAISDDGKVIGGFGVDPNGHEQAFVIHISPPAPKQVPAVISASITPAERVGGNRVNIWATISAPAPSGGARVLTSSYSQDVVPRKTGLISGNGTGLFFAEGETTSYEVADTHGVDVKETVYVRLTYGSLSQLAAVTLVPAAMYIPTLSSSTIKGGNNVQMTLSLNGSAPMEGKSFDLRSSDPNVASIPASGFFAPNAQSQTVTVTTSQVSSAKQVTLYATYRNVTKSATLTVTP